MIKRAANCSPRHGISDVITALQACTGSEQESVGEA